MMKSFGDKETQSIWNGIRSTILPFEIQNTARRKLRMLNRAEDIFDLIVPFSNRLEKLQGQLSEFYSIRISSQWRNIFRWSDNNASEVKIIDYH